MCVDVHVFVWCVCMRAGIHALIKTEMCVCGCFLIDSGEAALSAASKAVAWDSSGNLLPNS